MKKVLIPLALVAAAAAAWLYQRKADPPEIPFARATRGALISTLPTNGKVEPFEWQSARAEIAGVVGRVPVQEGQRVSRGDLLAALRVSDIQADLTAAETQIERARAVLATIERGGRSAERVEIESSLAKARLEKEAAQREYEVLNRLAQKNAATRAEVASARGALRQAEISIESLVSKRAALVSSMDKSVAEAELREGQAAAQKARQRLAQAEIRAPISGVVYNLAARPGAYLQVGDLVANVGRLDKLRVHVYVDEPELGRVHVGQPVSITWDALPGVAWSGEVEKIPAEITAVGTRQVGQLLCTIDNSNGQLLPGTNVYAEIRTDVAANALSIPKEAVRRAGGQATVLVLRGNRVVTQRVTLGASSATRTQVASGLNDGDSVALPSDRPLKDGDEVRPVYP